MTIKYCDNCAGFPKELPQGCVCEYSAHPGTFEGMVDGFRRSGIIMQDFIFEKKLGDEYKEFEKQHLLGAILHKTFQ